MSRFVYGCHAPSTPAGATPPSSEQMEAVMAQWGAWAGKVGDGLIGIGTPLVVGVRVTAAGTSPSNREVAGYSIIEAADMDAVFALAQDHPHLQMPGDCEIEVHEMQAVPGM